MPDSDPDDPLAERREQNRREGLAAVERWAEYVRNNPPEVWGPQQNRLVESQLESARQTDRSVERERAVRAFADDILCEEDGDPDDSVGSQ
jgi:hypothetical protein